MDKKSQNGEYHGSSAESIVGPSVKIDGDLKSSGNLRIDGMVTGKVSTSQNLYVGDGANITADINAENAAVYGAVAGNVKVSGGLLIGGTGKIIGDINCGGLQVEDGAVFIGKCQMKDRNGVEPVSEKIEKAEKVK
jgi:cytoskeletal protein CcmA (bactofilin family)